MKTASGDFPAPGTYNPDYKIAKPSNVGVSIPKNKSVSRTQKKFWGEISESPDPTRYDRHDRFGSGARSYSISKLQNKFKPFNDNPGPGYFDATVDMVKPSTPKIGVGKAKIKRDEFFLPKNQTPGPGRYSEQGLVPNLKILNFGNTLSRQQSKMEDFPAPGYYQPEVRQTRPSSKVHRFGKSNRVTVEHLQIKKDKSPSAQEYNQLSPFGSNAAKISISSKQRDFQLDSKLGIPSPADY